jgi:hypothetical protein
MSTAVAPTLWDYEVATPAGDGASLDQAITRLWGEVMSHHEVACPWCEGEMTPRYGAAALPVGARCGECGATLT